MGTMHVDPDQVLAFRLARSGLAGRAARDLAEAAACPASDFAHDAALLALAARCGDVSREGYLHAVDVGDVVVAYALRGAIHALAPDDFALYGRALIAADEEELGGQLGRQVQRLLADEGMGAGEALEEVATATKDALMDAGPLDKNELHAALRDRVRPELLPWCRGCESHHVAPMLWRYATVKAGVRLDRERRYTLGESGDPPHARAAVRRFLGFYGPATPADFAAWAGLASPHARRLWGEVASELTEVEVGSRGGWLVRGDVDALESPPGAAGVRLLPPGDPYLQGPNRPLLAPEPGLRKRMFRPVASPGVVLHDGVLAGLWRARKKGRKLQLSVEKLGRLTRTAVQEEAQCLAALRGAEQADVVLS